MNTLALVMSQQIPVSSMSELIYIVHNTSFESAFFSYNDWVIFLEFVQ